MASLPTLVILAGGASSRMWPLREKSLLRFGEEPLLLSQLQKYQTLGFQSVVIVGNPTNQADIESLIASVNNIQVEVVVQDNPIGMGNALLQTEAFVATQASKAMYVTQVHDVVDYDLHQRLLTAHKKKPEATHIAGYEMEDYFPGGYLRVDADGRVIGIVEKPGPENRPSNLVSIVAHIHADAGALFDAIKAEYASDTPGDDHYERAMDVLMQAQEYRVVAYSGEWNALKYPWHVLDIMTYYLGQIDGQDIADDAFIAEGASVVGNVYIGAGARVYPGAAVVGPAYIGAGTIVGNNALVRNSMVLDNCEVGFTTEIARSYVAEGCAMHACRVLDTVFAENVNFSAGCTTANLRIDRGDVPTTVKGQRMSSGRDKFGAVIGEGAFLGVDVMTMPGVKIGSNARIGPGTHVLKDVNDNSRVYIKQELVIEDDDD